jgi:hypothetical protein
MPTYADPIQFPAFGADRQHDHLHGRFPAPEPDARHAHRERSDPLEFLPLDDIFAIGGDVQAGVVLYDQATTLDSYTDRDVERIEPGAEAPIVGGVRTAPLVAQVEKFGGKFVMTAEAIRRTIRAGCATRCAGWRTRSPARSTSAGWPEIAANNTTF